MPDYTTIRERIAAAKRRGCKVMRTSTGAVWFASGDSPMLDPDHDADCRSHGVTIVEPEVPPLAPCPKCGGECRLLSDNDSRVVCTATKCMYGYQGIGGCIVRLADHPVRPDRNAEIVALFRELHERLGKLLEGKS